MEVFGKMKIVFLNGDDAGKTVELTPSGLTIGRETDNHLQLPVGGVSRYHARIEFVEGVYMLRDLGSTNGTKLNGITLQKVEQLKADDIIAIGEQQFRVLDPVPVGGRTDSKIGTSTVKIPANVPVPEPAVPQFVFRPDSEIQPPPPPPVTDSSETATVNITPDLAAAGSDFFAKRDGDGNLFKKEDDKKESGKSTLRGNLIFVLVLLIMICGGILLFLKLNPQDNKGKKKQNTEKSVVNENGEFFFFYEKQSVDKKTQSLIKKKVYCRRVGDEYRIRMQYNNHKGSQQVSIDTEEKVPADLIDDTYRDKRDITRYSGENHKTPSYVGNELEWTRLIIGNGRNISDVTATGNNDPVSFKNAEDEINMLIETCTVNGQRMRDPNDTRKLAEDAYKEAHNYLRSIETDPKAKSLAMQKFREAADLYQSLNSPEHQEKYNESCDRADKIRMELQDFYKLEYKNALAAYHQKKFQETIRICQKVKASFEENTEPYEEMDRLEKKCNAEINKKQKGKK